MDSIVPALQKTQKAAISLRNASDATIKKVLHDLAQRLTDRRKVLLKANAADLALQHPDNPRNDRLLLNDQRIAGIADSIRQIAQLPDPSGKLLEKRTLANGLKLEKRSAPLGVVGVIYESRPNVTFDVAALCLRSRNACVLKGSTDAWNTNVSAVSLIHASLKKFDIDPNAVTLLPAARDVVGQLFTATRYIDVLIPRGSDSLIQYVRANSRVPVIETGAGVCHVYIEKNADLKKAVSIAVNAKVSRPSVCNAVDTILVDRAIAPEFLHQLKAPLQAHGVEIYADPPARKWLAGYPALFDASAEDFGREFLSLKCAVKVVRDIDEALEHIAQFSTKHSEAIVSRDRAACERFLAEVDAAAVYSNASTRFTDGEEFGLGAEIGISTQKLHARGPFALEKLVTEKWILRGNGQVR